VGYRPTVQLDEIIERVIEFWEPQAGVGAVGRRPAPSMAEASSRQLIASAK
jgi:hypothetical protein